MKTKIIQNKNVLFLVTFIVLIVAGFGLVNVEKASAGYCVYTITFPSGEVQTSQTPGFSSQDQCTQYCSDSGGARTNCVYAADSATAGQQEAKQFQAAYTAPLENNKDVCPGFNPLSFKSWLNCFLLYVLKFIGFLLSAAATLFNWIIDPASLTAVISNPIIYTIWALVRDVLNIAFILVLLFSAFATIFQVEKFSWKNILLTLVIMALLVNFSFPIARFIIDFSNVLMYYFLNGLNFGGPTYSIFAQNAGDSGLAKLLTSQSMSSDSSALIAAVIFGFIFAVTLVIIAVLLVIRTVALAILIIFSSLAFVGSIVPFLSKYASQWWDNLFKYAFFGPIMIFMLYVASQMMKAIQEQGGVFDRLAGNQSVDPGIVSAMSFYSIPIIILWIGIGVSQSMSIAGAGAVVGRGKKFMGWAGGKLSGASFASGVYKSYKTRRAEAQKDSWRNKIGTWIGSRQDQLKGAVIPTKGGKDAQLRYERDLKQKVEDEAKRRDTANMPTGELKNLSKNGNRFEKAAAIQELANRGQATKVELDNVRQAFGETSQVFKQLANKVRLYDPAAAFSHITNNADRMTQKQEFANSNQFDAKKLNPNSLGDDELMEIMVANNAISTKEMLEISKSSPDKKKSIEATLARLVKEKDVAADETSQKIHMAHFAQTGEVYNPDFAKHIFSKANDETMQNITADTANTYAYHVASFTKNYKKTLQGIKDDAAKRNINSKIQAIPNSDISLITDPKERANVESARSIALKDPQLKNLK